MITLQKKDLKAILNASSKDNMRPGLQSVFFDIENKKMVATSGHMLFTFPIGIEGDEKNVLITSESLGNLLKVYPKKVDYVQITSKEGKYSSLDIPLTVEHSQFPDYKLATPSREVNNQFQVTLSRDILENLVKIAKESNEKGITFSFKSHEGAILVDTKEGFGVIMPMRGVVGDAVIVNTKKEAA